MILIKGMVVWLVFILVESLNGLIRVSWLVPALGEGRAEQLSFGMGSLILVAIATLFIRWLQASRVAHLLGLGVMWMLLTLAFEITLGRAIWGYSWSQIVAQFNVLNGHLTMPAELVLLILAPFIAKAIHTALDQATLPNASHS